eukprot:4812699-Alexandrium_andersonii.AAC.1
MPELPPPLDPARGRRIDLAGSARGRVGETAPIGTLLPTPTQDRVHDAAIAGASENGWAPWARLSQ